MTRIANNETIACRKPHTRIMRNAGQGLCALLGLAVLLIAGPGRASAKPIGKRAITRQGDDHQGAAHRHGFGRGKHAQGTGAQFRHQPADLSNGAQSRHAQRQDAEQYQARGPGKHRDAADPGQPRTGLAARAMHHRDAGRHAHAQRHGPQTSDDRAPRHHKHGTARAGGHGFGVRAGNS